MTDTNNNQSAGELFGPEYYASHLGPLPYERAPHWQSFFSIVAHETARSLRPSRVFDAGCAMGFLVEQFWDRGIYCEGIDISEYAISKVRSDIRSYCRVASLADPILGRFDLVTCIEVVEHLPPEQVRTAITNLCAAADTVLFSSSPSDFEEESHYSVHPPIYWLRLFSEFGFWPDARFDAGYITQHAMLLRKGAAREDDFLVLYAEYIRQKMAVELKSNEGANLANQLKNREDELKNREDELKKKEDELKKNEDELKKKENEARKKGDEAKKKEDETKNLMGQLQALRTQHHQVSLERARATQTLAESQGELNRLRASEANLSQQLQNVFNVLRSVEESRMYKIAEKARALKRDWPLLFRMGGSVARALTGRKRPVTVSVPPQALAEAKNGASRGKSQAPAEAYQQWIAEQEPTEKDLAAQQNESKTVNGPLLSVVTPVHEPDHRVLCACVESVLNQTYPRWEFCLAVSPGGDEQNLAYLRDLAQQDARIRLVELSENGGISRNTNAALEKVTGEYVALLDHDDTLAPFALFEVAKLIQSSPAVDMLYSDHDYLDRENGARCNPLFKPDWSPSIMYSANYITHLTVLRRSLVEQIGPFDPETDGAQDWDLFWRAAERTEQIAHIPKVLYHWRMHAGSTAHNDSAKNYAAQAQLTALRKHMKRSGIDAEPEVMSNGLLHVRFTQTPSAKVSIVIPTKDKRDLLERCISTLLSVTAYSHFEILIVDTGSQEAATHDYFRSLQNESRIRILSQQGPFNYNKVNNRAARESDGDFLLFLNNDVEITRPEWLTELVWWASLKHVGIVGAKLLRANGTIQHAGVVVGMGGFADHPFADEPSLTFGMAGSTGWYRDFLAVTGACMLLRRSVFEEIGGFDEHFVLCGSDVEICLRVREQGYRVVLNPFSELIHHERQTRGANIPKSDFSESLKHYRRSLEAGDPYWNPNLSLESKEPAFRFRAEPSSLDFAEKYIEGLKPAPAPTRPPTEEEMLAECFDCSAEQFALLRQENSQINGFRAVKRVMWFIPAFEVPFYGGIYTILRFCDSWRRQQNVEIFFAVCGVAEPLVMAERIRRVYADIRDEQVFVLAGTKEAANLPEVDVNICTLWTTAYYAPHQRNVARRFYLIQDFEPAFYRAGSVSALVESTYRMGLYGIANTVSLKKIYESEYGGKATYFTPRINDKVFYPADPMEGSARKPSQVFFYGRPKHPRNAFEMVKQAMLILKKRMGERIRIVSAGDEWSPSDYGLDGVVENLGLMSYEETGQLYRETTVGVVMMLTRHPSYLPLELMASGCLAVTNLNFWTSWLLKDGENCLLSAATATAIADTVERALSDSALRKHIRTTALAMVHDGYLDWESEAKHVYEYLCDPEAASGQKDQETRKTAMTSGASS